MRITKTSGRYNYCNYLEKSWMVTLHDLPEGCPANSLSEFWKEDDEPDIDGLMPSEVIELFEERLNKYLIHTGRKKKEEIIQWLKDHAIDIDIDWLLSRITKYDIDSIISEVRKLYLELNNLCLEKHRRDQKD